jgi:RNA polymerase sigma-70 factor (ECF subfamily)
MLTATHTTVSTEVRERSLIERLRDGDPDAFEAMVRRYGTQMLAVARRLVRNEDDAREVVQEAFLQAFRALDDFRADAKLSTWLHRIVVNTGLMRLRSSSRRPEGFIDDLLPDFDTTGHHANPVTPIPMTVEDAIEHQEVRVRVRGAVAQLPDAYRAIIVLRDFEDLNTEEAATALGISENAAKIRLHRARQALGTLLRAAA